MIMLISLPEPFLALTSLPETTRQLSKWRFPYVTADPQNPIRGDSNPSCRITSTALIFVDRKQPRPLLLITLLVSIDLCCWNYHHPPEEYV